MRPDSGRSAIQDHLEASKQPSRRRYSRSLGIISFLAVLLSLYAVAGALYASEHPNGPFITAWNWWVALGIGLLATGGLSLYFHVVSRDIPEAIKDRVDKLVEQLQCPIKGYHEVTSHIIDVCESATSHYYAATLMPLIGAIGDPHYYKRYRQALVGNIMSNVRVELVFLETAPLEVFVRRALEKTPELAEQRVKLVCSFAEKELGQAADNLEYEETFSLWRTDFIPYQVCIADGSRAVLYFGNAVDLGNESSVRAFYTEDRSVIEVLSMGFEQMRAAAERQQIR